MFRSRILLVPLVIVLLAPAAPAGIFSRKPKVNPSERVPELLLQLQTSQDEARRTAAAEELRQYEAKDFPKIIPALIEALNRDASPAVRAEAATSLGKLRPISQQAGYALEQAQNNDAVMRVRLAARQSLWQYHLVGYRGKSADGPAEPATAMQQPPAQPKGRAASNYPGFGRETAEPPLASPEMPRPSAKSRTAPPAAAPTPPPAKDTTTPAADGPALPLP